MSALTKEVHGEMWGLVDDLHGLKELLGMEKDEKEVFGGFMWGYRVKQARLKAEKSE